MKTGREKGRKICLKVTCHFVYLVKTFPQLKVTLLARTSDRSRE
jgi:hypothetical protein